MSTASAPQYVVSIIRRNGRGEQTQTRLWDSDSPLPLDHPIRLVLEKTSKKFRVRDLNGAIDETQTQGSQDISIDSVRNGEAVLIKLGTEKSAGKLGNSVASSIWIRIRPAVPIPSAYSSGMDRPSKEPLDLTKKDVRAYCRAGKWIKSTSIIEKKYEGYTGDSRAFSISKGRNGYTIRSEVNGLSVAPKHLGPGEIHELSPQQLTETTIEYKGLTWQFIPQDKLGKTPLFRFVPDLTIETLHFKKYLRYTLSTVGALLLFTIVFPQSEPDLETKKEVEIPAQYTRILMKSAHKQAAAPSPSPPPAVEIAQQKEPAPTREAPKPKEVAKTTVASQQAFRARALQRAVRGILKGGMNQLLAQAKTMDPAAATSKLFDPSKSSSAMLTSALSGLTATKGIQVAALGGGQGTGGVGYGKGVEAGVSGQGQSFVGLDTSGLAVEEGLSKDEVGRVIHSHLSEVRYCYESAMIRNSDIEGKLIVDFTIAKNGFVNRSEVKSSSLPDSRLDQCILQRLGTWKFPLPKGGVNVAVTYPFIFKTLGK